MRASFHPHFSRLLYALLFIFSGSLTHAQFFNSVEDNSSMQLGPRDSVGSIYYQSENMIVKVDSLNQNVLWRLKLDVPYPSEIYLADADTCRNLIVSSLSIPLAPVKTIVRSISSNGSTLWTRAISDNFNIHAPAYFVAKDGSIYLGGRGSGVKSTIIKLNSAGNLVWAKAYAAPGVLGDVAAIMEKRNGNLCVASVCGNNSDVLFSFFEINSGGNLLWSKFYKLPSNTVTGSVISAKLNSKGEFLLASDIQILNQGNGPLLMKVDSLGNLKWAKRIGSTTGAVNFLHDMTVAPDNAVLLSHQVPYQGTSACEILRLGDDSCQVLNTAVNQSSSLFSLRAYHRNHILCAGQIANSGRGLVCKLDTTFSGLCGIIPATANVSPFQVQPISYIVTPLTVTVSVVPIIDTIEYINKIRYEACKNIVGLSETDNSSSEILNIYPIPTNDNLFIEAQAPCTLQVFNQLAQLVLKQDIVSGKNSMDVSSLPKGIYFLRAETSSGVRYYKRVAIE